jgi:hypothetical protein
MIASVEIAVVADFGVAIGTALLAWQTWRMVNAASEETRETQRLAAATEAILQTNERRAESEERQAAAAEGHLAAVGTARLDLVRTGQQVSLAQSEEHITLVLVNHGDSPATVEQFLLALPRGGAARAGRILGQPVVEPRGGKATLQVDVSGEEQRKVLVSGRPWFLRVIYTERGSTDPRTFSATLTPKSTDGDWRWLVSDQETT